MIEPLTSPDLETVTARRLSGLAQVALDVARAETVHELVGAVVGRGLTVLGASGGAVGFRDDAAGGVVFSTDASAGTSGPGRSLPTAMVVPLEEDLPASYVVRSGEVVLLGSREAALERFPALATMPPDETGAAWALLPLQSGRRPIGVLVASWDQARDFSPSEVELLTAFAAQCAQALDRIQVREAELRALTQRESARQRLELLADVSRALTSTLDAEEAVGRLARMVVPRLADWSIVTLVDDDGMPRDVGTWHSTADRQAVVEEYARLRLPALRGPSFVSRALETGLPVIVHSDATERVRAVISPGRPEDLLTELGPETAAVFPLQARGRTVGLLSVYGGPERGPFAAEDLAALAEVAARAGMALDNARLFGQQRRLSETLQLSLLTEPPRPRDAHIVVRYAPAAEQSQVGGDWYDAFVQPSGATVLTIGDVIGHDTEAAAAMGQVRGLLRGIAYTTDEGPAAILSRLDAAMHGLQVDTTATAVVARVERGARVEGEDAASARRTTRLSWSNAGHPPPMVISPDGAVTILDSTSPDLLLGIDPATARSEAVVEVPDGSTILLYTDGLVERRGQSLDEGIALLGSLLDELACLPVEELCDQVLARMLPADAEDDVALVAVRLHPRVVA